VQSRSQGIAELVGISVVAVKTSPARVVVEHPVAPSCTYGLDGVIEPLFAAQDAGVTVLGKLQGSEQSGLVQKRFPSHTAWFSSVPLRGSNLLRYLLKQSGAHIYDDQDDVVYAGVGLLIVHSAQGGTRSLLLRNGQRIQAQLPTASTSVFDAETGEELLL